MLPSMMYRWYVTIEVFPHSTGQGKENDQAAAGDRVRTFRVDAQDIKEAIRLADCIADGIRSHSAVWQTVITGISMNA